MVNLYNKLELPVDYKAIRAAIDYIKKPIPDVVIKNDKGGLFSKGCFTLVSSSKKRVELKKHCPRNCPLNCHQKYFYIAKYRKVASSRLSRLVANPRIFRKLMKGKFDAYVVTVTFGQKVPKLISRPTLW